MALSVAAMLHYTSPQEKSLGNDTPNDFFTEQMQVLQRKFSAVWLLFFGLFF